MAKKAARGGQRKGAGRKPAPYKTTTISFRVRVEYSDQIKKMVNEWLKLKDERNLVKKIR